MTQGGLFLLQLLLLCGTAATAGPLLATTTAAIDAGDADNSTDTDVDTLTARPAATTTLGTNTTTAATDSGGGGSGGGGTSNDTTPDGGGGSGGGDAAATHDDRILGLPIPVFATIVSFFGTPLLFIMLCGAVAACKSLACRRPGAPDRNCKVAPSLASDSFDVSGGGGSGHEMREFPSKPWHMVSDLQDSIEAPSQPPPNQLPPWLQQQMHQAPPPRRSQLPDEPQPQPSRQPQQQPQQPQKLRNPYLEQLGQIMK